MKAYYTLRRILARARCRQHHAYTQWTTTHGIVQTRHCERAHCGTLEARVHPGFETAINEHITRWGRTQG